MDNRSATKEIFDNSSSNLNNIQHTEEE